MNDMNALERQLASVVRGAMRPPRPVDAAAIVRSVTDAAPTGRRPAITGRFRGGALAPSEGGFPVFSALRLMVASVIVALFGGFLLAGILTTPPDDGTAPAAVTESPEAEATGEATESPGPSLRTDILPGVELIVEEVEPGVFQVLGDGVRDLVLGGNTDIAAGHDDGIWLLRKNQFFRLGSEDGHEWPDAVGQDRVFFEVTPDGTVWVIETKDPGYGFERGTLLAAEGDGWTDRQTTPGVAFAIEVAPDGTLWASWDAVDDRTVGSLGPSGWEPLPLPPWGREDADRLHITDSGVLYTQRCVYGFCVARRYEDDTWRELEDRFKFFAVAPDGTVWQLDERGERLIHRIAGDEWPTSPWRVDGMQGNGLGPIALEGIDMLFPTSTFTAAPDGSLWTSLWQGAEDEEDDPQCDGLVRFDVTTATATADGFLPGRCVTMDIAADGSVWVLADEDEGKGLYVITPEAVAAVE